jgi:hypothetical protein
VVQKQTPNDVRLFLAFDQLFLPASRCSERVVGALGARDGAKA